MFDLNSVDNRNGINVNKSSSSAPADQHQGQQFGRQYQQPYGWSQTPQQNQYYANTKQQAPQQVPVPPPPQQQQQQSSSQECFVRNVPIVFEETGTPISRTTESNSSAPTSQAATNKPRPEPFNKDSFASNQPIPSDQSIPIPPHQSTDNQQNSGK